MERKIRELKLEKQISDLESNLIEVKIEAKSLKRSLDNSVFTRRKMSESVTQIINLTEL